MKSRETLAADVKISDKKLGKFLFEVVNAADDQLIDGCQDYFFHLYSRFFPSAQTDIQDLLRFIGRRLNSQKAILPEMPQIYYRAVIEELRDWLRTIWVAEDNYTAEWRLFNLQLQLHRIMDADNYRWKDKNLQPPPLAAPITQAFRYLHGRFDRLKRCGNPGCKDPFFIAQKGKQSYCSPECAGVAQKEYKRRWWKNSGTSWRESRRKRKQSKSVRRKAVMQRRKRKPA
jgi:hypothetical protein